MVFEVGIGTSQNWDPEKAANEAIEQALSKLTAKPTFALLFSTIHYEKNNGFQKILTKIYEILPKDTSLIGCSVPGIQTKDVCITKGISITLIHSNEIEINSGFATKTKQNPKKAAKNFIKNLTCPSISKYKNKILIEFISGPTIPSFPIINKLNLIKSPQLGNLMSLFLPFTSNLGFGVAKDEEILSELNKSFGDYFFIGGACIDDGGLTRNYQFFNNKILKNSIVGIVIMTNQDIQVNGFLEMSSKGVEFDITKTSKDKRILKKIEGAPATKKFLQKTGLSNLAFGNKTLLYRTTLFYPIGFSNSAEFSTAIGAIYGENILLGHKILDKKGYILSANGKYIFETPKKLQEKITCQKKFMFVAACETGLETLGKKSLDQKDRINEVVKETPFIITFFGGEHYKIPNQLPSIRTHSFNTLII